MLVRSGSLLLRAHVDHSANTASERRAAVLYLHGQFAFTHEAAVQAQRFRDAGFVTMTLVLRGENGQDGAFSLYYDEVDDVLAAAEALASLPSVDPSRVMIAGHSAGAVLAMLAAAASDRFAKVASISGWPDLRPVLRYYPSYAVFDARDERELEMRSPVDFMGSIRAPLRMYFGSEEIELRPHVYRAVERARRSDCDTSATMVAGNHFTATIPAIEAIIRWFRE
ncbi:MAG: alpha/beta fold hydrolase [Myxococcales bacterium]|nr:alpha/beta fold hydrolase [Myxococcales bacterium]